MSYDEKVRARALKLYQDESTTLDAAAAILGVSRRSIREWAKSAGLPRRKTVRDTMFDAETRARAVALYVEGQRMAEIGAATGAEPPQIREWARAAGVPIRKTHTLIRFATSDVVEAVEEHGYRGAAKHLRCSVGTVRYHIEKRRKGKA